MHFSRSEGTIITTHYAARARLDKLMNRSPLPVRLLAYFVGTVAVLLIIVAIVFVANAPR